MPRSYGACSYKVHSAFWRYYAALSLLRTRVNKAKKKGRDPVGPRPW